MRKFEVGAGPLVCENLGVVAYSRAIQQMDQWVKERQHNERADRLFLLEHPAVVTYGPRTDPEDLKGLSGVPVVQVDRGGFATYHGPGQLVGYLVVDVRTRLAGDLVRWVEERLIEAGKHVQFDLARRQTPVGESSLVGVWTPDQRKVASIGMRIRRGVSSHGFALNVDPDLAVFDHFVACGLSQVQMTSLAELAREQGRPAPSADAVRAAVTCAFGALGSEPV